MHFASSVKEKITLNFPGVMINANDTALIINSTQPLYILASAIVGGGYGMHRHIINYHVDKNYNNPNPINDLVSFAHSCHIQDTFVGLMTAVQLERARIINLNNNGIAVSAIVTVGLGNATAAGFSPPADQIPGTINIIVLVDANLSDAALVNAVITITEAKTAWLAARGEHSYDGYAATGTSSDALAVACTMKGRKLPYAGPATIVGWMMARAVRMALEQVPE